MNREMWVRCAVKRVFSKHPELLSDELSLPEVIRAVGDELVTFADQKIDEQEKYPMYDKDQVVMEELEGYDVFSDEEWGREEPKLR